MAHFKLTLWVGLVIVFLFSGLALAQGRQGASKPGCQERFDAMDTNKDGKVSKDEFLAAPHYKGNAEQMFKAMDVNERGYVTRDEFCSGKGMGMGKGMGGGMRQGQGKGANQ
jgi:hypothetical protein